MNCKLISSVGRIFQRGETARKVVSEAAQFVEAKPAILSRIKHKWINPFSDLPMPPHILKRPNIDYRNLRMDTAEFIKGHSFEPMDLAIDANVKVMGKKLKTKNAIVTNFDMFGID